MSNIIFRPYEKVFKIRTKNVNDHKEILCFRIKMKREQGTRLAHKVFDLTVTMTSQTVSTTLPIESLILYKAF